MTLEVNQTTFSTSAIFNSVAIEPTAAFIAPLAQEVAYGVQGDFSNQGFFSAGSSTVVLFGENTQEATGALSGVSAFNNLRIENTTGSGSAAQSVYLMRRLLSLIHLLWWLKRQLSLNPVLLPRFRILIYKVRLVLQCGYGH
jgi:hypothetical protein